MILVLQCFLTSTGSWGQIAIMPACKFCDLIDQFFDAALLNFPMGIYHMASKPIINSNKVLSYSLLFCFSEMKIRLVPTLQILKIAIDPNPQPRNDL